MSQSPNVQRGADAFCTTAGPRTSDKTQRISTPWELRDIASRARWRRRGTGLGVLDGWDGTSLGVGGDVATTRVDLRSIQGDGRSATHWVA